MKLSDRDRTKIQVLLMDSASRAESAENELKRASNLGNEGVPVGELFPLVHSAVAELRLSQSRLLSVLALMVGAESSTVSKQLRNLHPTTAQVLRDILSGNE